MDAKERDVAFQDQYEEVYHAPFDIDNLNFWEEVLEIRPSH